MNSHGGRSGFLAGAATIVVVPFLVACGGSTPPPAPPAPPPAASTPAPAVAPPTTAPSTPTTTAEPVAVDPPTTAADGTDYAVCATRPCEVSVRGQARIAVPGGTVRFTGATSKGLTLEVDVNGSGGTGTLTGCGTTLSFGNESTGLSGCRTDKKVEPLTPEPGTVQVQGTNKIGSTFIVRIAGAA